MPYPWPPGQKPPSARSLPGSRSHPADRRSTSAAGRTIPCLRSTAASLLGYTPPSRHLDDVREGIAARIRETDTTLLVCLDDANYLIAAGTYSILLYHLLRLYERWDDIRGAGVFAVTAIFAWTSTPRPTGRCGRSSIPPRSPSCRMRRARSAISSATASGRGSTPEWCRQGSSTSSRG